MRRRVAMVSMALTLALATGLATGGRPARGQQGGIPARQVTLFGILATPQGDRVDPALKKIEPQLKKLFPGHSFKLLKSDSKRLTIGQGMTVDLGDGWVAGSDLLAVLDNDGNIQFKFALELNGQTEFATIVRTPPNQLFFCDKMLPGGARLLIGLGGR